MIIKRIKLNRILSQAQHYIFDVDETLYHEERFFKERKKYYLDWYVKNSKIGRDEAIKDFLKKQKEGKRFIEICFEISGSFSKVQNESLGKINVSKFVKHHQMLVNFINNLQGTKLIFSDAPLISIIDTLKSIGIKKPEDVFHQIYSIDNFELPKPNLSSLEKIIRDHKIDVSKCVMVGDSNVFDISPAKSLGMKTLHINVRREHSDADFTFSNIDELISNVT